LERRIDVDLSVAGLCPPLHLPVAAGLAQGPGFPNLSCLGLLSDRERLAARAEQRGLSFSDLLVEYAQEGLDRDGGP
jgi:hypothetical protein